MLDLETLLTCALAALATRPADGPVHDLVAEGVPSAVFRFELLDTSGEPVPGRLTFVGPEGPRAELFTRTDAAPRELAVRRNVVYTLSGTGAITVPAGEYEVWASRGIEWSAPRASFDLAQGTETRWAPVLEHELDTEGWISGDFHLHTVTFSGHGDANLEERLISLVGEGVELAVATDHNHHTDYGPVQEALGIEGAIRAVTGNEVSVPAGHFNAFPLDPERPVAPTDATDARALFKLLRAEPNRHGVVPVIQLNHPRWLGIDYFGQAELDPITRVPGSPVFSHDFDTLEVFNGGEGWGYYDADVTERPVGSTVHWVLGDWFALLNRGRRPAAVGNSDSHTVHFEFAGYPRNFVPSAAATPDAIDVGAVASALREKRSFTTFGPFVEVSVAGEGLGGFARASGGQVVVELSVRAASWIDCDRVIPVLNGQALDPIAVPDTRAVGRLWTVFVLDVPRDGWVVFRVEGDDPLAPVVDGGARPVRPLAVTNPIWIDGDGDGAWTSPWDQARAAVASYDSSVALRRELVDGLGPPEHGLIVLAALEAGRPYLNELIRSGLRDDARSVRLTAARAAEAARDRSLLDALGEARERPGNDAFAELTFLRAAQSCGEDVRAPVASLVERHDPSSLRRYRDDLERLVPTDLVGEWLVAGPYPNPGPEGLVTAIYAPEAADLAGESWEGWIEAPASPSGYLDLVRLAEQPGGTEGSIAYARTWLSAPDAREVLYAYGADDGSRLWVNGELIHEDGTSHAATPYQHVGRMPLAAGWNRVLVKVENGSGAFGLYLRVFDPEVVAAREPHGR